MTVAAALTMERPRRTGTPMLGTAADEAASAGSPCQQPQVRTTPLTTGLSRCDERADTQAGLEAQWQVHERLGSSREIGRMLASPERSERLGRTAGLPSESILRSCAPPFVNQESRMRGFESLIPTSGSEGREPKSRFDGQQMEVRPAVPDAAATEAAGPRLLADGSEVRFARRSYHECCAIKTSDSGANDVR